MCADYLNVMNFLLSYAQCLIKHNYLNSFLVEILKSVLLKYNTFRKFLTASIENEIIFLILHIYTYSQKKEEEERYSLFFHKKQGIKMCFCSQHRKYAEKLHKPLVLCFGI